MVKVKHCEGKLARSKSTLNKLFFSLGKRIEKVKKIRETVEGCREYMETLISGPGALHLMYALRRMREIKPT